MTPQNQNVRRRQAGAQAGHAKRPGILDQSVAGRLAPAPRNLRNQVKADYGCVATTLGHAYEYPLVQPVMRPYRGLEFCHGAEVIFFRAHDLPTEDAFHYGGRAMPQRSVDDLDQRPIVGPDRIARPSALP